ncbi:MAG TPA: outer membrane beta-barrel protein, partial [Defluviitoga sp.]|nr:outer membrane beta-barrel protein [Defluviitoga sp.]
GYMGKKGIVFISILLVLSFTIFAANFEVGGGITYNGFSNETVEKYDHEVEKEFSPITLFGININGTYWFNQKMGVEVDFDFSRGTVYKYSKKCPDSPGSSLTEVCQYFGPSANFKYNLLSSPAVVNLKAGGGYYFYSDTLKLKLPTSETSSKLTGHGLAISAGAEVIKPIPEIFSMRIDNLKLKADVGYTVFSRIGGLKVDETPWEDTYLTMNGLKLGLGVIYNF